MDQASRRFKCVSFKARLQPYTMVKDHRTNEESGNPSAVLDGALDNFINAYLKWISLGEDQPEEN